MFTIAGARKKLQSEAREGNKPKVVATAVPAASGSVEAPGLFDLHTTPIPSPEPSYTVSAPQEFTGDQRDALKTLATHLLELREMLKPKASQ